MAGETIKIASKDGGEFSAYLSKPDSGTGPGIVMVQEIFGLTPWLKKTADMFAGQGYVVVVPDLFWRFEKDFIADPENPDEFKKGIVYRDTLDHDKAVEDMESCLDGLKAMPECNGKVGVTGFCLGGTMAYLAAARLEIDAAVSYYGTQIHEFLDEGSKVACPMMFHMGEHDNTFSVEDRDKIHAALIGIWNISIYLYDAGHAFVNSDRPDLYNREAAEKAHARTFDLFNKLV